MLNINTNFPGIYINGLLISSSGLSRSGSNSGTSNPDSSIIPSGNNNYVTLLDQGTSRRYRVYVNNGKLVMAEVTSNMSVPNSTLNYVTFIDQGTGRRYRVYVYNGKLTMVEVTT